MQADRFADIIVVILLFMVFAAGFGVGYILARHGF